MAIWWYNQIKIQAAWLHCLLLTTLPFSTKKKKSHTQMTIDNYNFYHPLFQLGSLYCQVVHLFF